MKAITLRNIDPDLQRFLEKRSKTEGTSFSRTILNVLEEYAGLRPTTRGPQVHHDLDHLAGTWSTDEADAFDQQLEQQRQIDPELWE